MIYLDYAATTPVDPRVLDTMRPYFSAEFGNPSSVHHYGQRAEAAVESAREEAAAVLGCQPAEVVFTSCGSESDNLALRGAALAVRERTGMDTILTARAEHHAVSKTAEHLERHHGFRVQWLEVDGEGTVTPDALAAALTDQTAIVSIMCANNEIGTINPIPALAAVCHQRGVLLHTDAVQAAAYLPMDVRALDADLISLGGHKLYGPKGVGALYVRSGTPIIPHLTGGGQEDGLRAGTHNVPYIAGFAKALSLAAQEREQRVEHVRPLRDQIIGSVLENIPEARLTGQPIMRLPNHASFVFKGVDGNLLLQLLDAAGFACSSGSACKTGSPEPSEVITALGIPRDWALGSLRVTLGAQTTGDEVRSFLDALPGLVSQARSLSEQNVSGSD